MSFVAYLFLCGVFLFGITHSHHYHLKKSSSLTKLQVIPANYSTYFLPTNLNPTFYDLTIVPFLENGTFNGLVVITFDVIKETNVITVNENIDSIMPWSNEAIVMSAIQNVSVQYTVSYSGYELFYLQLNDTLSVQKDAKISISYQGVLGSDVGFYSDASSNHTMAITQFKPTYARRAFPCFDEPVYRTPFLIKILRSQSQSSMSNMELDTYAVDEITGLILDTYKVSPPMPTYLVAFGVGQLPNGTKASNLTVFARDSVTQDAVYIESIGQTILDHIAEFVGVPYPLHKMGMLVVPEFVAEATENWGLVIFRENEVLYNPGLNSWLDKFRAFSMVAHEFGSQWFGNLVTPLWWDYSWLSAAFATYFEYTTSEQIASEWGTGSTMYVVAAVQYALDADVGSPRPMTAQVYTPTQIGNIFDYIIYEKGGSILRMTEHFLTTPVWRAGLKKYLTDNLDGTVTPEELFIALQSAAAFKPGLSHIKDTLQGWTTQPGYPMVTVALTASNSYSSTYNITQAPYELDVNMANQTWNIPLTFTTQPQPQWDPSLANLQWLFPTFPSMVEVKGNGWVIFNIEQVGFYRVNYDADNWSKIKRQLDSNLSVIGSINRAQLLDDAFHLARSGHLAYAMAFGLTDYLPSETNLGPWNAFLTNMRFLTRIFSNSTTGDGLKQYMRDILIAPFRTLTDNPIQVSTGMSPGMLIGLHACDIGLPECESFATKSFSMWRSSTSLFVVPEVKEMVMCTGLRLDSSEKAFMDVWKYYLASNNVAEKLMIINAMACLTSNNTITLYLDAVCDVNNNSVHQQDRWIAFNALVSRQTGISVGLQYIADNFAKVSSILGSDLPFVIATIADNLIQQTHIAQVQSIVNDINMDKQLRDMLKSTVLPAVDKRQQWVYSKQASDLQSWVSSYNTKSSALSATINILLMETTIFVILMYK